MVIVAKWTGEYPILCDGQWVLTVDGIDKSCLIPAEKRYYPMNTFGQFKRYEKVCYTDKEDICCLGDLKSELEEVLYTDGLSTTDWISENKYWLDKISTDRLTQIDIYCAFQKNDWRPNSCSGCYDNTDED